MPLLSSAVPCESPNSWIPEFHFYKPNHWINDPNGLFFFEGTYHLFYQMNPDDVVWGNMHWGHATSEDLISWEHEPIALYAEPEGLGYIFSGGAVVDVNNTSGFAKSGETPIVATFTHHSKDEVQTQSLAFSLDGGKTFEKYSNNPVIPNPGLKDFRDPKVVWYEPGNYWVKAVVAGQCVHFYRSENLLQWEKLSEFGHNIGAHGGVWECPDLFPLHCEQSGETCWVLLISINPGGPNGGSAMQYFIGDFDGRDFLVQDKDTRWLDYGTDFYAGITFDNVSEAPTQRTIIAWMSNWNYANKTPDNAWRGAMTLPRILKLVKHPHSYALCMEPVKQSEKLWSSKKSSHRVFDAPIALPEAYKLEITLEKTASETLLEWRNGQGNLIKLKIDLANMCARFDRSEAGFDNHDFAATIDVPLLASDSEFMEITVCVDTCSFEFFFANGERTLTALCFPDSPFSELKVSGNLLSVADNTEILVSPLKK